MGPKGALPPPLKPPTPGLMRPPLPLPPTRTQSALSGVTEILPLTLAPRPPLAVTPLMFETLAPLPPTATTSIARTPAGTSKNVSPGVSKVTSTVTVPSTAPELAAASSPDASSTEAAADPNRSLRIHPSPSSKRRVSGGEYPNRGRRV